MRYIYICILLFITDACFNVLRAENITAASDVLKVNRCISDRLQPGYIALSTYGSELLFINDHCEIEHAFIAEGPVAFYHFLDDGGYGLINDRIFWHDNCGKNLLPTNTIHENLAGWPHHEFRKTPWGTYITIAAKSHNGIREDRLVEFDNRGTVLNELSLNLLVFSDHNGSKNISLGDSVSGEHWLHTNSIDFLPNGHLIVSLRNISEIFIIDWQTRRVVRQFGKDHLRYQHFARYQPDTDSIYVYDNGSYPFDDPKESGKTSIVEFSVEGKFKRRLPLDFYAAAYGSFQRLDNGNWLVIDGTQGKIYEYSQDLRTKLLDIQYQRKDWIPFIRDKNNRFIRKPLIYRAQKVKQFPFNCD